MQKIKVSVPATVANIVCGYDVLGMALNEPCDTMELELTENRTVNINHTDRFNLPEEADKNVSGVALQALMAAYPKPIGFNLTVHKTIMPGSGLGSSAAGSAGAVKAANYLLDNYFSDEDLVRFAMKGEELASGVQHADNIAPCIYGSVTLIRSLFPLDIVRLSAPPLFVTVIHPQIEIKTSEARAMLPKEIPLKDAVKQWANVAGLVTGFLKKDYGLISRSLEDVIIEKVRSVLIPGFDDIKKQSREAGSLGGGISGSGPSVFMLNDNQRTAEQVKTIMEDVYNRLGIDYRCYVTTVNDEGIKVL
ncbi:MAG: homoserine kinase [Ferruginibacter sp.]